MANNYVLLERIELNASAASVTFSNIPQTGYTDLKVVISARGDGASGIFVCQFNGATTNLSSRVLYGINGNATGSSTYSDANSLWGYATNSGSTASTFNNAEILIPNYTSSNNKSVSIDAVNETNAADGRQIINAGLWSSSAAITSITLYSQTGGNAATNFTQYSTFSLYGLAAVGTTPAIAPKARGGNNITTDGTYWYHTFLSSGTFTPLASLTANYLVIGGGGGGGRDYYGGGGGGAGGLRSTVTATGGGGSLESALSLSAQDYSITVGAGGAGGGSGGGTNGSDSTLSTVTSIGGGGGGGNNSDSSSSGGSVAGRTGGSGGGGGSYGSSGAGTTNRGYAGGSSSGAGGAGGGGAGAVGSSTSSNDGAAGGTGVAISALASATGTGVSNYYAGGGAGAANARTAGGNGASGGAGGGGTSPNYQGTGSSSSVVNTGGGGYGSNGNRGPDNGASGLVIIRYAV